MKQLPVTCIQNYVWKATGRWLIILGYCVSLMGYLGVRWLVILGYLASQVSLSAVPGKPSSPK